VILARKIPLARETGISSARVEFKILKVAFVVRDFICVKNENPICKRWRNSKFRDTLAA